MFAHDLTLCCPAIAFRWPLRFYSMLEGIVAVDSATNINSQNKLDISSRPGRQ